MQNPHTVYHHRQPNSKSNPTVDSGIEELGKTYSNWLETKTQHSKTAEKAVLTEKVDLLTAVEEGAGFYKILGYQLPEAINAKNFFKEMRAFVDYDFSSIKLVTATFADQESGDVYCIFDHKTIEEGRTSTDRSAVKFAMIMALKNDDSSNTRFILDKRDHKAIEEVGALGFKEDLSYSSDSFVRYSLNQRSQSPKTLEA